MSKYIVKTYIPAGEEMVFEKHEDVVSTVEHLELLHPENIYKIEVLDEASDEEKMLHVCDAADDFLRFIHVGNVDKEGFDNTTCYTDGAQAVFNSLYDHLMGVLDELHVDTDSLASLTCEEGEDFQTYWYFNKKVPAGTSVGLIYTVDGKERITLHKGICL